MLIQASLFINILKKKEKKRLKKKKEKKNECLKMLSN